MKCWSVKGSFLRLICASCCICRRRTRCRGVLPLAALGYMVASDLARPFRVARLRLRVMGLGPTHSFSWRIEAAEESPARGSDWSRPQTGFAFPARRISFSCATGVQAMACGASDRSATRSLYWRSSTFSWRCCSGSSEPVSIFMDTLIAIIFAVSIAIFFVRRYLRNVKKNDELARQITEKAKLYSESPKGLHPHIDANDCIGCATCTTVCPEGDVLAMLGGKAVIANGQKCIGHGPLRRGLSSRRDHHGHGQPERQCATRRT